MEFDSNLSRGAVDLMVLKLVAERAMYGYEIIKIVNERTKGAFEWKEGTLYPCLHRLEGAGMIDSEWQDADSGHKRKYYVISRKGQGALKEKVAEWKSFYVAANAVLMLGAPA